MFFFLIRKNLCFFQIMAHIRLKIQTFNHISIDYYHVSNLFSILNLFESFLSLKKRLKFCWQS